MNPLLRRKDGAKESDTPSLDGIAHRCVVQTVDASGMLTLNAGAHGTVPAYMIAPFFGSMAGVRMRSLPEPGSECYALPSKGPWIVIGFIPSDTGKLGPSKKVADGPSYQSMGPNRTRTPVSEMSGHRLPVDMVEGELCLDNAQGVMLAFLSNLVKMEAGPLAAVECHVLNDMVRIISENYHHHSAFGDMSIVNDHGKLTVEWHGTSEEHEASGLNGPTDPKAELDRHRQQTKTSPEASGEDEVTDGRWRYSQYVGWIGDFINLFLSDPADGIQRMVGEVPESCRSGKFRTAVTRDGSFLLQSVSDIVLERVVRVSVPTRIRSVLDGDGDRPVDEDSVDPSDTTRKTHPGGYTSTLEEEPLSPDWKPSDVSNPHEALYHLRHYARWLNSYASLLRFRELKKDFYVPSESETPAPDIEGYIEAYSTIRIFRDGSILLYDAYSNSFQMTREGITMSSPANLRIEAAGNAYVVVGGRLNIVSGGDMVFTSLNNVIKFRVGQAWLQLQKSGNFVAQVVRSWFSGKVDVAGDTTVGKIISDNQDLKGPTYKTDKDTSSGTGFEQGRDALTPGSGGAPGKIELEPDDPDADDTPWYESLTQQNMRENGEGEDIDLEDWQDAVTKQNEVHNKAEPLDKPASNSNLDIIRGDVDSVRKDQTLKFRKKT